MTDIVGFILNIITVSITIITVFNSSMILIWILYNFYHHRLKQEDKTIYILSIHIYLLIAIDMMIIAVNNLQTLLGDLYEYDFNASWCVVLGYLSPCVLTALYWAFINQAFYRFCCIMYPIHRRFQSFRLYIILIPIELVFSCLLISPVLFWNDIVYLPNEHYCYTSVYNIRGTFWLFGAIYGLPIFILTSIYLSITIFLRRQSTNQTLVIRQRQQRDFHVIKRIIATVGVLMFLGIPATVLLIIMFITGNEHPLTMRIIVASLCLQMLILSMLVVSYTPQLKNIILRKFNSNPVQPVDAITPRSIQTRNP